MAQNPHHAPREVYNRGPERAKPEEDMYIHNQYHPKAAHHEIGNGKYHVHSEQFRRGRGRGGRHRGHGNHDFNRSEVVHGSGGMRGRYNHPGDAQNRSYHSSRKQSYAESEEDVGPPHERHARGRFRGGNRRGRRGGRGGPRDNLAGHNNFVLTSLTSR